MKMSFQKATILLCLNAFCAIAQTNNGLVYSKRDDNIIVIEKRSNCTSPLISWVFELIKKEMTESVVIPETINNLPVEVIKSEAFVCETNLREIIISKNIWEVGSHAFFGCTSLTNVVLKSSPYISSYAFYFCTNLQSVFQNDYDKKDIKGTIRENAGAVRVGIRDNAFGQCKKLVNARLGNNIFEIGDRAFSKCESLSNIKLPSKLEYIGKETFSHCKSLKTIEIPSTLKKLESGAFSFCENLHEICIPAQVETIGSHAFANCSNLVNLTIQDGVKEIGAGAFFNCSSLKSVTIPKSVETIAAGSFFNCTNLESVFLQEGLKNIGQAAFKGCDELTSIRVPLSVTNIDESAFRFCNKLTNIVCENIKAKIGESAFEPCEAYYNVAISGNQWSQLHLGKLYLLGIGITKDEKRGLDLILKAAKQGNIEAKELCQQVNSAKQKLTK